MLQGNLGICLVEKFKFAKESLTKIEKILDFGFEFSLSKRKGNDSCFYFLGNWNRVFECRVENRMNGRN